MTVFITGTLKDFTREQALRVVIDNGGRATETFTADTSLVVSGNAPDDSVIDTARRNGVPIMYGDSFYTASRLPLTLTFDEFTDLMTKGDYAQ